MNVKELRLRKGLTQKQLARLIQVDSVTISRWERGTSKPSRLALTALRQLESDKEPVERVNRGNLLHRLFEALK